MDLRGSPALLPAPPTMPLFPHVLDLLAPLDSSSSRALPSSEGLDDLSDGDVFGPELDTLLDSLVSPFSPSPLPPGTRHGPPHAPSPRPTRVEGCPLSVSGGDRGLGGRNWKLQYVQWGGAGSSWFLLGVRQG